MKETLVKYQDLLKEKGLKLARHKLVVLTNPNHAQPLLEQLQDTFPDAQIVTEGMTVLGVPVGTPAYVQRELEAKVDETIEKLKKLNVLWDHKQQFLLLWRYCGHPLLNHLLRSAPTWDPGRFDEFLLTNTQRFLEGDFQIPLNDLEILKLQKRIVLPIRLGGLGITKYKSRQAAAVMGMLVLVARNRSAMNGSPFQGVSFESVCPPRDTHSWYEEALHAHRDTLDEFKSFDDTPAAIPTDLTQQVLQDMPSKTQKRISHLIHEAEHKAILADNSLGNNFRAILRSAQQLGAASFLAAIPTSAPFQLSNADMSMALVRYLGMSLKKFTIKSHRVCGKCNKALTDYHLATAVCKGVAIRRHNEVVDQCTQMCRAAGLSVDKEARVWQDPQRRNKADMIVHNINTTPITLVDVSISEPTQQALVQLASTEALVAAGRREEEKRSKYTHVINDFGPGTEFVPFVLEGTGAWGNAACQFLEKVKQQAKNNQDSTPTNSWTARTFKTYWLQRISVAFQRQSNIGVRQLVSASRPAPIPIHA